ncbi:Uncharacterised protein (plasmid) [Tsukamurella tyrosinosolvens]|uniref:Uncharacterized protein n=1 Tax=Tsukamurella tyrosinosolvens TaxID=57704 RepID=A0A1H4VMB4_TSUTY|nr:hypothetical protein [Tsukamurella tyrosinosolvens]KXO90941.1 hypothetical protein AXK58_21140 [Tsukamurella tyrosinosolvens]SEC82000.1 hypothetical protein SAMN04489793_3270 [Tsukamurella tyrosinosolvens]VEH90434.1 Uncharacterised protein [Tsukamurella tyrosinosolvens]
MSTDFNDDDLYLVQSNGITVDPEPIFGKLGITLCVGDSRVSMAPDEAENCAYALLAAVRAFHLGIEIR